MVTDLTITRKVAQFGRGVLAEVSAKLLGQFVDSLHDNIANGPQPTTAAAAGEATAGEPAASDEPPAPKKAPAAKKAARAAAVPTTASEPGEQAAADAGDVEETPATTGPRRIDHPEPEPVDLIEVAGGSAAKRVVPLLVVALLLLLVVRRRRAHRGQIVLAEVLS